MLLYRLRRLIRAVVGHADAGTDSRLVDVRREGYDKVLYQWNDALNTNLAIIGSHFGEAVRTYLDLLYDDFRRVGAGLEDGLRAVRRGEDPI